CTLHRVSSQLYRQHVFCTRGGDVHPATHPNPAELAWPSPQLQMPCRVSAVPRSSTSIGAPGLRPPPTANDLLAPTQVIASSDTSGSSPSVSALRRRFCAKYSANSGSPGSTQASRLVRTPSSSRPEPFITTGVTVRHPTRPVLNSGDSTAVTDSNRSAVPPQ